MNDALVLVTGAAGHIGFRIVTIALQYGYRVRAVARNEDQIHRIETAQAIQQYLSNLQVAIVPDIVRPDALDSVMEGITHSIHAARINIQPNADFESSVLRLATQSVGNVLAAASSTSTVKRVVFTSSIIAMIPWEDFVERESDTVHDHQNPVESHSTPSTHKLRSYAAFKSAEVQTVHRFCVEHPQVSFDTITIYPGYAIGGNELDTDHTQVLSGSNRPALGHLLGQDCRSHFGPFPSCSAHLNDVAEVHVRSLSPNISGGHNFIVSSGGVRGTTWEDGEVIAKARFSDHVRSGTIPLGGSVHTHRVLIDAQKTKTALEMVFQSYEQQVTDLVVHYLRMMERVSGTSM